MADKVSRFAPTGSMDKDSDPRYVGKGDSNGDYIDARNIQCVPQDGNENGSISPTLGNEFAFSLGEVSAQNKKYRLTFDGDPLKQHELRFLSTQRDASIIVGTGSNGGVACTGDVLSFINAFNLAIAGSGVSWTLFTGVPGQVDIELQSYPMYQWYIDSVGPDDLNPIVVAEAIPTDLAGPLKDISSYDLLGDLFIFSTTQDNEPTELPITITAISPTIAGGTIAVGPITTLTFSAPHGLEIGNYIRITNSNNVWLNGLFVVNQVLSATQIGIPTVLAWGGQLPQAAPGPEVITVSPNGIGEIGVAQKDENTDTWTYIRLLRSVELNFVSKWRIDCDAEKSVSETSFYFDDDYNVYRRFYYIGEYVVDGALLFSGTANDYQLGSIAAQLYGFMPRPYLFINYIEQSFIGGSLLSGNYRYFAVLKDYLGNESKPSDLSRNVIVYADEENGIAIGSEEGVTTTKSTTIQINNIDMAVFNQIAIGYVSNIGGVIAGYITQFQAVQDSTMYFTHRGLEPVTNYDVAKLSSLWNALNYDYAKNIRIIDQRVVRSNLRRPDYADLAGFFSSFKHSICVEKIDATLAPSASNPAGEFKDVSNVFYKTGYMFNETYRFSGRVVFKDGSISEWFWIDDIKIDPLPTNSANITDNRRSQTSPNIATSFDLTEDITGIIISDTGRKTPAGDLYNSSGILNTNSGANNGNFYDELIYFHKKVLVPYVEFFDFSTSYPINGNPLSAIVSYIEIGRCDVIEEVLATGVSVSSVKIRTANELNVPQETDPSSGGIWRGPSLVGEFDIVNAGSNDLPDVQLGLGVRTGDRDITVETYHEYPFVYSSFPISKMGSGQALPNSNIGDVAAHNLEHYLIIGQGEGEWINTFHGHNTITSTPIQYPSSNGVDFCYNNIPTTVDVFTVSGSALTENNFGNYLRSETRYISIYSPDMMFGLKDIKFEDISSIIDFGEMFLDRTQFSNTYFWKGSQSAGDKVHLPSCVSRYLPENIGVTYNEYSPDAFAMVGPGERVNLSGYEGFRKAHDAYIFSAAQGYSGMGGKINATGYEGLWKMTNGPVAHIENAGLGVVSQGKNPDHGIRYVQIFKKKINKYGVISESEYRTTGSILKIQDVISVGVVGPGTLKIFGGDTYTQQSFLKTKVADISVSPGAAAGEWSDVDNHIDKNKGPGFAGGLFVYTQNRSNSQLRYDTPEQFVPLKDTVKFGEWAWDFNSIDQHTYSQTYNGDSGNGILQSSGNEGLDVKINDFPTRINWSQKKIYGELSDSYSLFLDFDIKDLDLRFGEIFHHENVNGELFTLQVRKWMSQYFNTRGELQVSGNALGALIGDGSVMSRDGQTLSRYGTQNKWSAFLGTSIGGKDTLFWYNSENGLFLRFGADGTSIISDARKMRAFSNRAANWLRGKDAPSFEQGIRTVWDDRSKEMIWTFTGWRSLEQWVLPTSFLTTTPVGLVLRNDNAPSDSFEEFPRFFRCILTHVTSVQSEPGVGVNWQTYWEQISYNDFNYYSIFTLAHNESTNGFSTFYGHIPKTYLKWRDTFLSSHPTERNLIYEHRRGLPTTWYESDATPPKVEDAFIEAVFNDLPEESKRFISTEVLSENIPDRIEYRTKSQYTWSEPADFKVNDDQFRGFILNDATVSQDPRGNTRRMDGDYVKAKFFFIGGTMNKLYSMVVKLRGRLRDFRQ
jgi:hypothetical protein